MARSQQLWRRPGRFEPPNVFHGRDCKTAEEKQMVPAAIQKANPLVID